MSDAMAELNRTQLGVVLAVDAEARLQGTISDGDIRRAVLDDVPLTTRLRDLLAQKAGTRYERPTVAYEETPQDEIIRLMQQQKIDVIPIVDSQQRVLRVVLLRDYVQQPQEPIQAVIMAGGFGKRLRPLTNDTPKPMLRIAGRPLLERTIGQLRSSGIEDIAITTHYLPDVIKSHFGSGDDFGVRLRYIDEDEPLGTAGALNMVGDEDETLLVVNGDILTAVDYRAMMNFHRQRKADFTVGVRQFDMQVPYGVIEAVGGEVSGVREKPKLKFLVNAGIYILEPTVRKYIPQSQSYDMPELIQRLVDEGLSVTSFPVLEYWLDIGQHDDYERAHKDVQKLRWVS